MSPDFMHDGVPGRLIALSTRSAGLLFSGPGQTAGFHPVYTDIVDFHSILPHHDRTAPANVEARAERSLDTVCLVGHP